MTRVKAPGKYLGSAPGNARHAYNAPGSDALLSYRT